MSCVRKIIGYLFVIVFVTELGLLWWVKNYSPGGLIQWVEIRDESAYYGPDAPDPPYQLSQEDSQLLLDMVAESGILDGVSGDFETIAALRNWSREICPEISVSPLTNDPSDILEAFERGQGGACGAIGSVYCAALIAHGYRARVIQLIRDPDDVQNWNSGPPDTHIEVEVYSPDHLKWIVSDPFFNCWFHLPDSNAPLSARELQLISLNPGMDISETGWISVVDAGIVIPEYDGFDTQPKADTHYIDPVLLFKNVFLLYNDIYGKPSENPAQKYSRLLTARFLGTEKIVRLLPPDGKPGRIVFMNMAANWLPLVGIILLVILLIPSRQNADEDDEEEEKE